MYMSEGKNRKMNVKQISERLNKENVKKGFEYIRRNGVSRFWTLAKAKAFPAGKSYKEWYEEHCPTKEELMRVHDICRKNELLVFSDEIHSDIVYKQHSHTVFAQLSDWALHHSIVAMAPSKTFNLAGLEMSHITIANDELRKQFQYYERFGLHVANGNSFGLGAAQAAYEHGEDWYQALLSYLKENLDYLDGTLKARVPQVKLVYPEATYIPILDMQALGMEPEALKHFVWDEVGAALNAGTTFGPGGERFMRINVATQRKNLELFIEKLERALEARK